MRKHKIRFSTQCNTVLRAQNLQAPMKISNFHTEKDFINQTVSFILSLRPKTLALSGGNTPEPIYTKVASSSRDEPDNNKLFLQNTAFYQVDERYVPANHPDSNQRMIRKTLFKNIKNPTNFHYFDTTLPINDLLKKYEKALPVRFDLCILGIGHDGHIASLFPDSQALKTAGKAAHTSCGRSEQLFSFQTHNDRLTITLPQILASKTILVLLKDKPEILTQLQNPTKTPSKFPALYLLKHPNLTIHNYSTIKSTP